MNKLSRISRALPDREVVMKLYHMPGACSLADLIVLQWVGAAHEPMLVDLETMRSPQYREVNPGGTVPLLRHGDFALTENIAILTYLADLFPEAQLLGDGTTRARAEVMRWLAYLNSDVHGAFKPIFTPVRFLPDRACAAALGDAAGLRVRGHLRRLDDRMKGRAWLVGSRSIADPYLFVICRWAIRKEIGLDGFDELADFVNRMNHDEGVLEALAADSGSAARMPTAGTDPDIRRSVATSR